MQNTSEIFKNMGVNLTEKMHRQFETYCNYLLEENSKYNLTAITTPAEVWEKHFLDSVLGACFIQQNATVCDIGSGAGFPSLPLKILRNDISVTLVDSLEKRISFTQSLCKLIEVQAEFFHQRAEDFAKLHSESFDVVTARAVAPLPILLEYAAQAVKIGGTVIAYKTDLEELKDAQNACKVLGLAFCDSKQFQLPSGAKRCILQFAKTSSTPAKYPRGQNKPRKQPL